MRPASVYLGGLTFTLRDAVEEDVPALAALLDGVTTEDLEPYLAAFRAIDADPAQMLVVAEDLEGAVAATLQLTLIPGMGRAGLVRGRIAAVRVDPAHLDGALGSLLARWAADEARARGAGLIEPTPDP